jgi:hypothetical protein
VNTQCGIFLLTSHSEFFPWRQSGERKSLFQFAVNGNLRVLDKRIFFRILVTIFEEGFVNGMRSEVLHCPDGKYIYIYIYICLYSDMCKMVTKCDTHRYKFMLSGKVRTFGIFLCNNSITAVCKLALKSKRVYTSCIRLQQQFKHGVYLHITRPSSIWGVIPIKFV